MNGLEQVSPQLVVRLVGRQIKLIEARVSRRQTVSRAIVTMNLEFLRPVHALECGEALQRHLRASRDELHELGLVSLIERPQSAPEPDNLQRGVLILVVLRVGLEVVDVDGGQPRDEQFELLLVEDGDESTRDDVVKALQKGRQLLLDGARHFHLTHESHVVVLVLLVDLNVAAVGNEITNFFHAEFANFCGEGEIVAEIFDAMLVEELEALEEGVVFGLHIRVLDGFGQNVLVKAPSKVTLEQFVVVNGLGDNPADEREVVQMVGVCLTLLVDHVGDFVARRRLEQRVHGVEDFPRNDYVPINMKSN